MKRTVTIVLLLPLIGLAMGLKGELVRAPELEQPQAGDFDTDRALARLKRVLKEQQPHAVDTAENDLVRSRLVAELRGIGLEPVVTDDFVCNGRRNDPSVSCARIRNVLATVGPSAGRHVLLVSHYDSTPAGPGASDDGIGMAAMLEAAAVLKDRPLRRPVSFLFNEGEEAGLIGARAFLERDPLASRVDTVINLESRGTSGPAIMFETSRPNGRAIAHYARSVEHPAANSLTTGFYNLIPNSTDVAVFEERPWTILNFAIIGNETRYHSPGDRIEALDPRSLGHMGAQALGVAADLARGEPVSAGDELLYMDLLGSAMITLPVWLGLVLLGSLLLGYAWLGWSRRAGVLRGAGAILTTLMGAALSVLVLQALIGWLRPEGEFWRAYPALKSIAVDVTALAAGSLCLLWLARSIAPDRLRLAYWLLFLMLGAAISAATPGAAIYFIVPPAVAAFGLLAPRFGRPANLAAAALLFLSWVPLLHLSQVLLDFDAAWLFAPVSALILLPLLIELKDGMSRMPRRLTAGGLAAAALAAWVTTAVAPAYSDDRKQRMTLEYAWDASTRHAQWLVYHDRAELPKAIEAVGRFRRGVEVPWSGYRRWAADARGPAVEAPSIERLAERRHGDGRIVTLRLRSGGAEQVRLRAAPETRLRAVSAGGRSRRFGTGKPGEPNEFRCRGRSCDGLVFELLLGSAAPVDLTAIGIRSGLPKEAAPLLEARPSTAQPQYAADSTIAVARLRL